MSFQDSTFRAFLAGLLAGLTLIAAAGLLRAPREAGFRAAPMPPAALDEAAPPALRGFP
jgi:hypothetical protein